MKRHTVENIRKFHDCFIKDDYVQMMMGFKRYLMLYGEYDLKYFKNLRNKNCIYEGTNSYVEDYRNWDFPYSFIPEHYVYVMFQKYLVANQILEIEKPFIRINDGVITQTTIFKKDNEAFLHQKVLNNMVGTNKSYDITREELDFYFQTGFLKSFDEQVSEKVFVFDLQGTMFTPTLEFNEDELLKKEKDKLIYLINDSDFAKSTVTNLETAINGLEDIKYFNSCISTKIMLKIRKDGTMSINTFTLEHISYNKYRIKIANIPIIKDSLKKLLEKYDKNKIATLPEPRISPLINPGLDYEIIKAEKDLVRKRIK